MVEKRPLSTHFGGFSFGTSAVADQTQWMSLTPAVHYTDCLIVTEQPASFSKYQLRQGQRSKLNGEGY